MKPGTESPPRPARTPPRRNANDTWQRGSSALRGDLQRPGNTRKDTVTETKQTLVTPRWTFPQRDLIQVRAADRITVIITVVHRCQNVKGKRVPKP